MEPVVPSGYIERILKARVYDVVEETPLDEAPRLSERLGNRVLIKREDLHAIFSFKVRGAYNKMALLPPEQLQRGVMAASAGNHAQGVAFSALKLGVRATIVMPTTTPSLKVNAVLRMGAETILHGDAYDDAYEHAVKLAEERNLTFIHPYDDPDVIAGQGTVAMELLRQLRGDVHAIFVPVGGGGLIAGIAAYVKYLYPEVRIVGVQPKDAASLHTALAAGKRVALEQVGIFVDGVAVRQIGAEPFRVAQSCVDEVILVTTDEICAAIKDIFEDTRSVAEPAGALGVAGLKSYVAREKVRDRTFVAIESGANINFDRLRHVAERAELGENREALFAVTVPESPGSFKEFCRLLGRVQLTEFNYRYGQQDWAQLFVGFSLTRGEEERQALMERLQRAGYRLVDLTHNEMAKMHVRFMVGGRAPEAQNEVLYRFEFPERPGALLEFLSAMSENWNISLFHYRNHGAAWGRVLVGIQVPEGEQAQFQVFLQSLGYVHKEETQNPAYGLFLR